MHAAPILRLRPEDGIDAGGFAPLQSAVSRTHCEPLNQPTAAPPSPSRVRPFSSELGVSINTVRTYVRSAYEKLHVHSRSEAVSKAVRAGLI